MFVDRYVQHHKIIHLVVDNYPSNFEDAKGILNNPNTSEIEKEILFAKDYMING